MEGLETALSAADTTITIVTTATAAAAAATASTTITTTSIGVGLLCHGNSPRLLLLRLCEEDGVRNLGVNVSRRHASSAHVHMHAMHAPESHLRVLEPASCDCRAHEPGIQLATAPPQHYYLPAGSDYSYSCYYIRTTYYR